MQIAHEEGRSLADVIREALDQRAQRRTGRLHFLGVGASDTRLRCPPPARVPTSGQSRPVALIVDTGPLFAAMDRSDPDHHACRELLETAREPLVVSVPVLVEVEWLATSRLGPLAFDSVLASVADGGMVVRELDLADWARVRSLCRTYADLPAWARRRQCGA